MNPVEQNEYDKYLSYLNSRKWAELRDQALQRDEFHCVICNNPHNLEVHHLRYPDVLGTELISDLMTLCRECHKNLEEYKKGHKASLRKTEWRPPQKDVKYWIKAKTKEDANRIVQYNDQNDRSNKVFTYLQDENTAKMIWVSDKVLEQLRQTEEIEETIKWIK